MVRCGELLRPGRSLTLRHRNHRLPPLSCAARAVARTGSASSALLELLQPTDVVVPVVQEPVDGELVVQEGNLPFTAHAGHLGDPPSVAQDACASNVICSVVLDAQDELDIVRTAVEAEQLFVLSSAH
jgi:hypothetical protein